MMTDGQGSREQRPAADHAHMVLTKGPLHQHRFERASTPTSVTRGGSSQTHAQASCRHSYLQDCLDRLAAAEAGADNVSTACRPTQQPQRGFQLRPSSAQLHGQLGSSVMYDMRTRACESEDEGQGESECQGWSENDSQSCRESGSLRGSLRSEDVSVRNSGVVSRGECVAGEEREGCQAQQQTQNERHYSCRCGGMSNDAAMRIGSAQTMTAAAAAPGVAQRAVAAITAFVEPAGLVGLLNSPAVAAAVAAMNLAAALQFQQLQQAQQALGAAPCDGAVHRAQSCSTVSNAEVVSRARRLTRQQQRAEQARQVRKQQDRLLRQQRQRLLRLQQARRAGEVVAANTAVGAAAIAQVLINQHTPTTVAGPAQVAGVTAPHVPRAQQVEPHWPAGVAGRHQHLPAYAQPTVQPVLSPACSTNSSG